MKPCLKQTYKKKVFNECVISALLKVEAEDLEIRSLVHREFEVGLG